MNKKNFYLIAIVIIAIAGIWISRRIYIINEAQDYLVEKYKFDKKDLSLKSMKFQHSINECVGECFTTEKVKLPLHLKFNYNNEIITVVKRDNKYYYDDYLYDELYYGVSKYYAKIFDVDSNNVYYYLNNDSDYPELDFLSKTKVTEINDNVIENYLNFLNNTQIKVYIKMNSTDNAREMIKKIDNNVNKLKFGEIIELYWYNAKFSVKEFSYDSHWDLPETKEYYFFKNLYIENYHNEEYNIYSYTPQ